MNGHPLLLAGIAPVVVTELWARSGDRVRPRPGPNGRWQARRERRQLIAAVPNALDALVVSVRGGRSLVEALREVSVRTDPVGVALRDIVRHVDLGASLASGCARWAAEGPSDSVALVGRGLAVVATVGGPVGASLEMLAAQVREDLAHAAEVSVFSAQARISAVVVGALPFVVVIAMAILDPYAVLLAMQTSAARVAMLVGLGLDLVAVVWMMRIIRRVR